MKYFLMKASTILELFLLGDDPLHVYGKLIQVIVAYQVEMQKEMLNMTSVGDQAYLGELTCILACTWFAGESKRAITTPLVRFGALEALTQVLRTMLHAGGIGKFGEPLAEELVVIEGALLCIWMISIMPESLNAVREASVAVSVVRVLQCLRNLSGMQSSN